MWDCATSVIGLVYFLSPFYIELFFCDNKLRNFHKVFAVCSNAFLLILLQFTRPRGRGKKLQEEWAVPVKSVEDINEVTAGLLDISYIFIMYR